MDEEIAFHLEMRAAELVRDGAAPDDARRQALREFGDVEEARRRLRSSDEEAQRARRRTDRWSELRQDVRFAARQLRRSPGFTLLALFTLALGVGANTAVFTLVNGILLRSLPYEGADRIVTLWQRGKGGGPDHVSDENFRDWQRRSRSFEAMAYYTNYDFTGPVTVLGAQTAVRAWTSEVSRDFFRVFAVRPVRGRLFTAEERREGGAPVALVSYGFWQGHLGGDPRVLGRTLDLYGTRYDVVGVLPPGFSYPADTEIWLPAEREGENHSRGALNWPTCCAPAAAATRAAAGTTRGARWWPGRWRWRCCSWSAPASWSAASARCCRARWGSAPTTSSPWTCRCPSRSTRTTSASPRTMTG